MVAFCSCGTEFVKISDAVDRILASFFAALHTSLAYLKVVTIVLPWIQIKHLVSQEYKLNENGATHPHNHEGVGGIREAQTIVYVVGLTQLWGGMQR